MAVGLYARISLDVAGDALGVARQEADCRTLAKLRGWDVAYVATDNDLSAYKVKVIRPGFERLLTDLASGVIDGIVTYDLDRFARQPADLERAIRIYDTRPGVFATVQGDIDLSSSDGRTMARVMVAFANKASMDTSRRVKRKHLELAMSGVPVGGHRPFGYERDKITINKAEAKLIRQGASDILAGVGIHTICRQWNEQGVLTTAGNPWRRQVLKHMMLSPRLAGYRVYQGGIARHPNGRPVTGLYKPILTVKTWQAVCAVLTDPSRRGKQHVGGKKYLLTGIIRCGNCGVFLTGNADTKYNTFAYVCKSPTSGGCGKVSISGPRMDAMITELVLQYLAEREVTPFGLAWSEEDELTAVTSRSFELMNRYTEGALSGEVVFPAITKLEAQATELRLRKAAWLRTQVAIGSQPTNAQLRWPVLGTDERRVVIQSVFEAIVIKRASSRGGKFDPSRASLVWRVSEQSPPTAQESA